MTSFRIIIPARYQSSRLPGKVLMDIAGKPMLQHVYEKALKSGAKSVVIATDDARIEKAAKSFGADICMTKASHPSGTDRLAETIDLLGYDANEIIVNVQGDEPLLPVKLIQQVANNLAVREEASVATLCERIYDLEKLKNPNSVKVVLDANNYALYFSRSVIPWLKNDDIELSRQAYYRHIGLYAYRAEFVLRYVGWGHCPLESTESLEQLRVLWHGGKIHVDMAADKPQQDVNTEEDLFKVRELCA